MMDNFESVSWEFSSLSRPRDNAKQTDMDESKTCKKEREWVRVSESEKEEILIEIQVRWTGWRKIILK